MKRRISWNLAVFMARRGITTATELSRLLAEQGRDITPTHAARIVREMPRRLDTELLQGLLNVLDCSADELFGLEPIQTAGAVSQMTAPAQAVAAPDTNALESGSSSMDIYPGPAAKATTGADPAPSTDARNSRGGVQSVRQALPSSIIPDTPLF